MQTVNYFDYYYRQRSHLTHDPSIDALKIVACLLVVTFNSLEYIHYYSTPFNSWQMVVLTMVRMFSLSCVPLFFMITGYLMTQHQFSFKNYYRLLYLILYYALISLTIFLLRRFILHESLSFSKSISMMFAYTISPYAWFIGMYLCVFLLIPLLNQFWHAQKDLRAHTMIILSFAIICVLPSIFNSYQKMFPDYFVNLYPLFYYLLGGFIQELLPRFRYHYHFGLILIGSILISTMQNVNLLNNKVFHREVFNQFSSWAAFAIAFSLFCLIKKRGWTLKQSRILRKVASLSLPICLFSFIIEQIVYPIYKDCFSGITQQTIYLILPIVTVFILSFLLSLMCHKIYQWIFIIWNKCWRWVFPLKKEVTQ